MHFYSSVCVYILVLCEESHSTSLPERRPDFPMQTGNSEPQQSLLVSRPPLYTCLYLSPLGCFCCCWSYPFRKMQQASVRLHYIFLTWLYSYPTFVGVTNSNFPLSLLPLPLPYYLNTFYIKISIKVSRWLRTIASTSLYKDRHLGEGVTMLPAYTCTSHLHPLVPHLHMLITNLCQNMPPY